MIFYKSLDTKSVEFFMVSTMRNYIKKKKNVPKMSTSSKHSLEKSHFGGVCYCEAKVCENIVLDIKLLVTLITSTLSLDVCLC